MSWQNTILLLKLDWLSIFYPWAFIFVKHLWRFILCEILADIISYETFSFFSPQSCFSFLLISLPKFPWFHILSLWNGENIRISMVISSEAISVIFKFTSSVMVFPFPKLLSFLANYFLKINVCKISLGCITGRQEGNTPNACCLYELNKRETVTNHHQSLKYTIVTDHNKQVIFVVPCALKN